MRKYLTAALAVIVATAVAVPVVTAKDEPKATFKVLEKVTSNADGLPPLERRLADLVVPGSARYVGKLGKANAYVAAGSNGSTCFLHVDDFGIGGGCLEAESLSSEGTFVGNMGPDGVDLMIPVPDGYTDVEINGTKIKAENNVVLTTVPKKDGRFKVVGGGDELTTDLPFEPQQP